jgi:hypothetical protein
MLHRWMQALFGCVLAAHTALAAVVVNDDFTFEAVTLIDCTPAQEVVIQAAANAALKLAADASRCLRGVVQNSPQVQTFAESLCPTADFPTLISTQQPSRQVLNQC